MQKNNEETNFILYIVININDIIDASNEFRTVARYN